MASRKHIQKQLQGLQTMQVLTQTYAEIAALRMKKIRESVVISRGYYSGIFEIFQEVLASYVQKARLLAKKKRGGGVTFLSHNGRSVAVLFSSQVGLYGDIVNRTFDLFIEEVKKGNLEATIIGRYGMALFSEALPNHPVTFFDFPDEGTNDELFAQIARHLVQYESIELFYPKFKNLVTQDPVQQKVSSEPPLDIEGGTVIKYIFEPDLDGLLVFFETEVFKSVFEQTIQESRLAKHAARIVAMESAREHIQKSLDKTLIERTRALHRIQNKKQLSAFAGLQGFHERSGY